VYKLEISFRQKGKIKFTLNTYVVKVGNIKVAPTQRFIMFNVKVHQHFLLSHGDQIKYHQYRRNKHDGFDYIEALRDLKLKVPGP
jgi:hypothetical protein